MVYFQHNNNATCRIGTVGPSGATRPLEIATGWGTTMGIVARQYEGNNSWTNIRNELILLNSAGNTIIPRDLTVNGRIINTNLQTELNNRSLLNHTHSITDNTGILPIVNGGTNANNSEFALANLNLRTFEFITATSGVYFLFSVEALSLQMIFDIYLDRHITFSDTSDQSSSGTVIFKFLTSGGEVISDSSRFILHKFDQNKYIYYRIHNKS